MRIIITGGGTAGHVNPAAAIAEEILEMEPNSEILFIGREGGKENRGIQRLGLKIETLRIRGFRRRIFGGNIKTILLALSALKRSTKIISDFSPDAVIGTGGYVCWPVLKAAKRLGVPTLIHESNAVCGLVTKRLSRECDRVLLGYDRAKKDLGRLKNISVVGNPLRKDFSVISRQTARKRLKVGVDDILIISFGGSGGAEALNKSVIKLMKELSLGDKRIRHIHAVGERYYSSLNEDELKRGKCGCRILPYIEDMPLYLSAADIALTRSGALTLTELSCAGVASILVPSPNVAANHQYENARVISDGGGAVLVEEGEGFYERLKNELTTLINDKSKRSALSEEIKKFSDKDSAKRIYKTIKELVSEGG